MAGRRLGVTASVILTVAAVSVLVGAERTGSPARLIAKPLASAGFVMTGVGAGATDTSYGRWMLVGLGAAAIGDLLLLRSARPWFLAGLGAFFAAHLGYSVGFSVRGINPGVGVGALLVLAVPATMAWRWLRPHLGTLRSPVALYIAAISVMVAAALATGGRSWSWPIVVGAVAFYLSDLAVARDRFVAPGFANRAVGLPLYYGAQLLLALGSAR